MNKARQVYNKLPLPVKNLVKWLYYRIPFTAANRQRSWVRNVYFNFGQEQRQYIMLSIARFCNINRPINGYYFEFGCHEANTMRQAWDTFHHLFDWDYVAFDSFEGLPDIQKIDEQKIWEKGKLKTEEDHFRRIVTRHGMPSHKLTTVKGFYDQSLNKETARKLSGKKAAVVYIDCDLYASTVPVLNFIKDFLQPGTIIVFDDWNCFMGDPLKGERLAWKEFRLDNPELRFEPFVSTNEAQSFIYLGNNKNVE